ncbi:MAG: hypothetical protein RL761_293 [Pseudomonadota bacterium]|jgi:outer membrane biogenesis lipoprotein LolB
MFSVSRHRLALSCIAFAALTACSGGSSDPAVVAGDMASKAQLAVKTLP